MSKSPKLIVYTDGAARGNPGPAAAAFILQDSSGVIWSQQGKYLGETTNNIAEYSAVKLAFEKIITDFSHWLPSVIEVRADSNLIVNQLSGKFKIKNQNLKLLFDEVKKLESKIGQCHYKYIPRADNFLADKICNNTLDNL